MSIKTTYTIQVNKTQIDIQIDSDDRITVQGNQGYEIDWVEVDKNRYSLIINGKSYSLTLERKENGTLLANINGKEYTCTVEDERSKRLKEFITDTTVTGGPIDIRAPMPGMVTEISINKGDSVTENQPLLMLEAMKMENEIRSLTNGVVKIIHIQPGQPVEKGQPLVTIES